MADLKLLAKGGLVILIIVSLAILIERLTSSSIPWEKDFDNPNNQVLQINTTFYPLIDDSLYNADFLKCLKEHSKSYYYPIAAHINISFSCALPGRCIHEFLIGASKLLDSLNIKFQLIEPSLLFCLLPSARKYNLATRGFSSSSVRGLKNVVTFGVHHSEAQILDEPNTRKKLVSQRYRILRFQQGRNVDQLNEHASENIVSHYFLIQYDMVIHLIVFYPRGTYLFTPAFDTSEVTSKGLQYVNDRAFENFTTSKAYLDTLSTAPIYLPSDMRCFLLDMMSSEFLKCKTVSLDTVQKVHNEALLALKELKTVLASQMVTFWLWSKSLQGWYEKCDVQHYSASLQFSVAAKSIEGFNFSALFTNSECQYIESPSNFTHNLRSVDLNCYGVPVHLIFMYESKITYWYEYIEDDITYKLTFPKFTLCSTDIYGEKINMPCETDEIFDSQYGPFLRNTTLSLNPKTMENVFLMESV